MEKLTPCQIAQLANFIATYLACGKSTKELGTLKNIASQVSSTLSTILFEQALNEKEKL